VLEGSDELPTLAWFLAPPGIGHRERLLRSAFGGDFLIAPERLLGDHRVKVTR
jgi:hypothetical protein